ncbi:hypothetical protein D8674_025234 [Pyrus ussuriensis x Pyrus communis]|uniref:Uncharacterized protein n=1 Tax=Pyrus ussuriensis x Pyrus communis TaxID=2448454 RepID=A0A5N5HA95_9ROSA|nr:hypothetical protein D8674_025234 [Pyrus ussuriensis x Pyrus communis]
MRALIHPIRDFGRIIGNYGPQSEILKRNRKFPDRCWRRMAAAVPTILVAIRKRSRSSRF